METIDITVTGMSCSHCEAAVRDEVGRLEGVQTVVADAAAQSVHVEGDRLDEAAIRAAIVEAGYDPA